MTWQRGTIEKSIVALVSATIALIFVLVAKPWDAHLPRSHPPTDHQPTVATRPVSSPAY